MKSSRNHAIFIFNHHLRSESLPSFCYPYCWWLISSGKYELLMNFHTTFRSKQCWLSRPVNYPSEPFNHPPIPTVERPLNFTNSLSVCADCCYCNFIEFPSQQGSPQCEYGVISSPLHDEIAKSCWFIQLFTDCDSFLFSYFAVLLFPLFHTMSRPIRCRKWIKFSCRLHSNLKSSWIVRSVSESFAFQLNVE